MSTPPLPAACAACGMEQRLQWIFANVNDWLRYAEQKHTNLLAACGVVGAATASWLAGGTGVKVIEDVSITSGLFACALLVLCAAITICYTSFLPALGKTNQPATPAPEEPNLIYFGDIARLTDKQYAKAFCEACNKCHRAADAGMDPDAGMEPFARMIVQEIVVNSATASRKYTLYRTALKVSSIGLMLLVLAGLTWWFGQAKL